MHHGSSPTLLSGYLCNKSLHIYVATQKYTVSHNLDFTYFTGKVLVKKVCYWVYRKRRILVKVGSLSLKINFSWKILQKQHPLQVDYLSSRLQMTKQKNQLELGLHSKLDQYNVRRSCLDSKCLILVLWFVNLTKFHQIWPNIRNGIKLPKS